MTNEGRHTLGYNVRANRYKGTWRLAIRYRISVDRKETKEATSVMQKFRTDDMFEWKTEEAAVAMGPQFRAHVERIVGKNKKPVPILVNQMARNIRAKIRFKRRRALLQMQRQILLQEDWLMQRRIRQVEWQNWREK